LSYARAPRERSLTASGVAYLPFATPSGPGGAGDAMLHVLDGGAILARRAAGPSLEVLVGAAGRERYGSCLARLGSSRLAEGWLPILQTTYRDADGGRYAQESFAASTGGRVASYVRVTATAGPVSRARVAVGPLTVTAPARGERTLTVRWAPPGRAVAIDDAEYASARAVVGRHWRARLAEGTVIDVPEAVVRNARRALLVQALTLTWRYGYGNAYEQFSFPETVDMARTVGEHGFEAVAAAMLRAALPARPTPYPNWKRGEKMLGVASHWALFRDRRSLADATPKLRAFLDALERQLGANGLLPRERYSSDIAERVYGLHAQARVWQGLRALSAAWAGTGRTELAARARALAARLGAGLRTAVLRSERQLPDGSLFVPVRLLDGVEPYGAVTASRAGSYWNLVAPYALASGLFAPGSAEAQGTLRYLQLHGARLLGLVRTAAPVLYGPDAGVERSGVNPVYGSGYARFLADLDEPDLLVTGLYGQLAAGMTRGTFVAGEGTSVAPLDGVYERTAYLPPNGAANASFLETLRLLLVHETTSGLDLAFAIPRPWLAAGKRIAVDRLPTRFGPVSYAIDAGPTTIRIRVEIPARTPPPRLRLRLRLPAGERLGTVTPVRPVDRRSQTIDLTGLRGTVELDVARGR
ncbi:MAG: hypothetical protein OEV72_09620, partial [Thermoleophilia bacterium]|nr:hypothetical protein [Thermoleophilia bacterium]